MRTLLLSAAVAALTFFAACSTSEKADKAESKIAAKIENCTNTDSLKAYVEEAKAYIVKLQNEGKIDEAKKFLEKIEPVVKEKAPALVGTFTAVGTALDKVTDSVKESADSAKTAVTDSVTNALDNAKAAVSDAADKAKTEVTDAAEKTKTAVTDAAEKTKDAAADAARAAADKLKK